MQLSDYHYHLPEQLIAKYPLATRSASKLLVLNSKGVCSDHVFSALPNLLNSGDVLVLNDSQVIKARLFGHKASGGKVEILVERITSPTTAHCHIKASNPSSVGSHITIGQGSAQVSLTVTGRHNQLYSVSASSSITALLNTHGHMPLPPYFNRDSEQSDDTRYQTVYANPDKAASVAAPTAGLHFDQALLAQLQAKAVHIAYVTLHVGSGTFVPVRVSNITEHSMHSEWAEVSAQAANTIAACKARGNQVVAVGTTAARALESAAKANHGNLCAWQGETDIFIYPGVPLVVVDRLITNFHLPESTLLMLVSALAGQPAIMAAYQHAIANNYRFYSYGDAMLIDKAECTP